MRSLAEVMQDVRQECSYQCLHAMVAKVYRLSLFYPCLKFLKTLFQHQHKVGKILGQEVRNLARKT
jgi:hypothetical protein